MVECYYNTTLRPRFNEEPVKYVKTKTVKDGCDEAEKETPKECDGSSNDSGLGVVREKKWHRNESE